MKHYQSLKKAIGTMAAAFAERLVLHRSTVYKWTEPYEDETDSGSRNPVATLEQIIETSIVLGKSRDEYFAPLHYLDMRFGRVCVDVVPTDRPLPELATELCKTIKEFGDMVQAASTSFMDNDFTKQEQADTLQQCDEALRQAATFTQAVRKFRAR